MSQIIQIIACTGIWHALFKTVDCEEVEEEAEDEDDPYFAEPVACWLLCEDRDGGRDVRPGVVLAGTMSDATVAANFLGIAGPNDDFSELFKALTHDGDSDSDSDDESST